MPVSQRYNFELPQDTSWSYEFPIAKSELGRDLANVTIIAQAKKQVNGSVIFSMTPSVNLSSNTVTLNIAANATTNLVANRLLWDMKISWPDGTVKRPWSGTVTIVGSYART